VYARAANDTDAAESKYACIQSKAVMAVGPEGGWEDREIVQLNELGFRSVNCGDRVLRTDTAVSGSAPLSSRFRPDSYITCIDPGVLRMPVGCGSTCTITRMDGCSTAAICVMEWRIYLFPLRSEQYL